MKSDDRVWTKHRSRPDPAQPWRGILGYHTDRLSGLHDLLGYAEGKSVLDVGTNNGLIPFQFALRGASLIHGCDIDGPAIDAARVIFTDVAVPSRFEVLNLAEGPSALEAAFGKEYRTQYDVVLFLGVYNKLKDQTSTVAIAELVRHLADRTREYFVARSIPEYLQEMAPMLAEAGLRRVHFSDLSPTVGPLEAWRK